MIEISLQSGEPFCPPSRDAVPDMTHASKFREQLDAASRPCLSICIVDDDRTASFLLGRLLEKLGQKVHICAKADAAIDLVRKFRVDILISDVSMPGISGYDLARMLREEFGSECPFLVALTGFGRKQDRDQALASGFDEHVVKPIGIEQILEVINCASSRTA